MTVQELFISCDDFDKLFLHYINEHYDYAYMEFTAFNYNMTTIETIERIKLNLQGFYNRFIKLKPVSDGKKGILYILPCINCEGDFETKSFIEKPRPEVLVYEGEDEFLSPMFAPWNVVAGWLVSESIFKTYDTYSAASHIIWELTFCGYNEDDIQEKTKTEFILWMQSGNCFRNGH